MLGNLRIVEQERPTAQELAAGAAGAKIAEAAFYIHQMLGPGLDESLYRACFARELAYQNVPAQADVMFPVMFRDAPVEPGFRADFVVGGQALVFVIAEEKSDFHKLQIRSLLRLSGLEEAYIVNFRVPDMRQGIMRATLQKGHVGTLMKQDNEKPGE